MNMAAGLAASEVTNEERCEHLLGVIACALTGKRLRDLCPWMK